MRVLLLVISFLVMSVGLLGCFIPFLPGPPLVFIGALIYAVFTKFTVLGGRILAVLALLAALGFVLDYLATAIGAKKLGASRVGVLGAVLGLVVGTILLPPYGAIIGAFLGALLGELVAKGRVKKALKAGLGSLLGILGGSLAKLAISVAMIVIFVRAVF